MLAHGDVCLRVPRDDDVAVLVAMRNRERRWFGDQSQVDPDETAEWLAGRHDEDRLLCIEINGVVLGTIGWSRLQVPGRIYEVGRMIADYGAARNEGVDPAQLHRAVRLAVILVSDHLGTALLAEKVYVRIKPENRLPRKMYRMLGLQLTDWPFGGSDHELECWYIDAAGWAANRSRVLAWVDKLQVDSTSPSS